MKDWWRYQRFKHVVIFENSQETQLNQRKFYNLQSHLTYQYIKWCCVSISHTVCESLVKIQNFSQECLLKMFKNSQKTQQNQEVFHNLSIKMCTLIRHTFCESLAKICFQPAKNSCGKLFLKKKSYKTRSSYFKAFSQTPIATLWPFAVVRLLLWIFTFYQRFKTFLTKNMQNMAVFCNNFTMTMIFV